MVHVGLISLESRAPQCTLLYLWMNASNQLWVLWIMTPEPMSALTSAGVVVRVQPVTIATGAVVSSNVVVAEMIAERVLATPLAALVYV